MVLWEIQVSVVVSVGRLIASGYITALRSLKLHSCFVKVCYILRSLDVLLLLFQGWIDNYNGPSGLAIAVSLCFCQLVVE